MAPWLGKRNTLGFEFPGWAKGVVVPTSEQGDEVERYDNQPEVLSSEKSETSLPVDKDRYEPVKKGIEETPVNIRDAQDFPNNI